MRSLAIAATLIISLQTITFAAAAPEIHAEAACLIVAGSQRMLYGKDEQKIMYPASTTKIMTALVALERSKDLDAIVPVSKTAASCEGSSADLQAGDRLTLRDMLYGLLLVSGNDAAEAIAEKVGGSLDGFVAMMNQEAQRMGANKTHFANPHGLPNAYNHFTTAYDLAVITSAALKQPEFLNFVSSRQRTITFLNSGAVEQLENTNQLLDTYPGANGVKTGYTNDAGPCLVASAKRNGVQLIAVIFNDEDRWQDAAKLLNYGFAQVMETKGIK